MKKFSKILIIIVISALTFLINNNVYAAGSVTCNYTNGNNWIKIFLSNGNINVTTSYGSKCIESSFLPGDGIRLSYDTFVDYYSTNKDINCSNIPKLYANVATEDYTECHIDIMDSPTFEEFSYQGQTTDGGETQKSCVYSVTDGYLKLYLDTTDDVSEYNNQNSANYGKYVVFTVDTSKKEITSHNANNVFSDGTTLDKNFGYNSLIKSNGSCVQSLEYYESGGTIGGDSDNEFVCTYKGMMSGKTLTIKKRPSTYIIEYPDGSIHQTNDGTGFNSSNVLPTEKCEDVFFSMKDEALKAIFMNDYTTEKVSSFCLNHTDVEQFCSNGNCNINDAKCGNSNGNTNYGTCPSELQPAIYFIKKVVINTLQLFIPILLILLGIIDMTRSVMGGDDKSIKDSGSRLIRRFITAILFFFVTTIVSLAIGRLAKTTDLENPEGWKACWNTIGAGKSNNGPKTTKPNQNDNPLIQTGETKTEK